jgi:hypothetical protein
LWHPAEKNYENLISQSNIPQHKPKTSSVVASAKP